MADWLVAFGTAFAMIFLFEMGDKTQLMTISFAAKYPRWLVFWAVYSAMALLTLMAVAIGGVITRYVPIHLIQVVSGIVFILFGVWGLWKMNEEGDGDGEERDGRKPFAMIFTMLVLAELGDKTQLATITLASSYDWLPVALGGLLGFAAVVALGVALGEVIARKVKREYVVIGAAVFSMAMGAYFICEALI
ncbi:MAG: TMEM165/GDT1 family protein [Methanobacteriota archaeon]